MVTGNPQRFYYGWVIVAVSFLSMFLARGICESFGLFYLAILREYGWGRAETAGAFSLAMVVHGCSAPVTGILIDRFGPRIFFPLAATFLATGLFGASRIIDIWHLYLFFGVIMAIGINTFSLAPHMSVISKWFMRGRGLANGLVLAGIGVGTVVLAPSIQLVINVKDWRFALLILGGITLGVLVPMTAVFHRRSPEEVGQYPDGIVPRSGGNLSSQPESSQKKSACSGVSREWRLGTVLRTTAFWWLALTNSSAGFLLHMMIVHQAAHTVDAGYSPTVAAALVGLVGLLGSVGGILCGFLSDRVGRAIGFTLGSGAAFAGIVFFLLIPSISSPWILCAFVILYGLGRGSIGPIYAATTGDLFAGNSLGRILGTLSIGFGTGGALGAYVGGYLYDQTGTYTYPFLLSLASICMGTLGMWMAAPRHRRISSSNLER